MHKAYIVLTCIVHTNLLRSGVLSSVPAKVGRLFTAEWVGYKRTEHTVSALLFYTPVPNGTNTHITVLASGHMPVVMLLCSELLRALPC